MSVRVEAEVLTVEWEQVNAPRAFPLLIEMRRPGDKPGTVSIVVDRQGPRNRELAEYLRAAALELDPPPL